MKGISRATNRLLAAITAVFAFRASAAAVTAARWYGGDDPVVNAFLTVAGFCLYLFVLCALAALSPEDER